MTGNKNMKTTGKFEINFFGWGRVEEDNYSSSTYRVDGMDMFHPDSGGQDCFDRAGYIQLGDLAVGKRLQITIPSGQLEGRITKIREEKRQLALERGIADTYTVDSTTVTLEGTWKGTERGFFNGQSACAEFRPIDGVAEKKCLERAAQRSDEEEMEAYETYGEKTPPGVREAVRAANRMTRRAQDRNSWESNQSRPKAAMAGGVCSIALLWWMVSIITSSWWIYHHSGWWWKLPLLTVVTALLAVMIMDTVVETAAWWSFAIKGRAPRWFPPEFPPRRRW